jgi:hypothetical protein
MQVKKTHHFFFCCSISQASIGNTYLHTLPSFSPFNPSCMSPSNAVVGKRISMKPRGSQIGKSQTSTHLQLGGICKFQLIWQLVWKIGCPEISWSIAHDTPNFRTINPTNHILVMAHMYIYILLYITISHKKIPLIPKKRHYFFNHKVIPFIHTKSPLLVEYSHEIPLFLPTFGWNPPVKIIRNMVENMQDGEI